MGAHPFKDLGALLHLVRRGNGLRVRRRPDQAGAAGGACWQKEQNQRHLGISEVMWAG